MDDKEILEILDSINIDEKEFDNIDVELNDIEKKRIKNKYNKSINRKRRGLTKVAMAAGLTLVIGVGAVMATPVMAINVPVLGSVYEKLGIYDEYKDYTTYVGESQQVQGGTYTIEEIMVTPYESMVAVKITGNEPLPEGYLGFSLDMTIGNVHWSSGQSQEYRIDQYNSVIVMKHRYDSKVPEKATINIRIQQMDTEEKPATFGCGNFDLKVDFGKSYEEVGKMKLKNVSIDEYALKFKEVNTSIMGTQLVGVLTENWNNGRELYAEYDKLQFLLNVDGKIYGSLKGGSLDALGPFTKGRYEANFEGLNHNTFTNAQEVRLLVYKSKYNMEERIKVIEDDKLAEKIHYGNDDESVNVTENGVTYPKTQQYLDGSSSEFYKVERDDNTVRLYYKGKSNQVVQLGWIGASSNITQKQYYSTVSKDLNDEDSFVVEIVGVPIDDEITVYYGPDVLNEYSMVKEFKIK